MKTGRMLEIERLENELFDLQNQQFNTIYMGVWLKAQQRIENNRRAYENILKQSRNWVD